MDLEKIKGIMFSEHTTKVLVSTIYAACEISKKSAQDMINLPMRAFWREAYSLQFHIDKLLTKEIERAGIGKLPYHYREIKIPGCGYPYSEYYSEYGRFHIKKVSKKWKLPDAKKQRVSNAQSNKIFLDFGEEFILKDDINPFAIVTFGHKKFIPSFVVIGYPEYDYSEWAERWDVTTLVSREIVEQIRRENESELKDEFREFIERKPILSLKGD